MKKAQQPKPASNQTLSKLMELDADLSSQSALLETQLETIQKKRKSLGSVLHLFANGNGSVVLTEVATEELPTIEEVPSLSQNGAKPVTSTKSAKPKKSPRTTAQKSKDKQVSKASDSTKAKVVRSPQKTKKSDSATTPKAKPPKEKPSQAKESAQPKASDGETWQPYLQSKFQKSSLPEVVAQLLQKQPDELVEIATLMNTIFVKKIPPDIKAKARNRVSNILSEGVRKNRWYRGKLGNYSISQAAASV